MGQGPLIHEVSRSHTGILWTSDQLVAETNIQHSQQTNIHAPGGIRTHNLSRRAAAELRLRPRGHWHWQGIYQYLGDKYSQNTLIKTTTTTMMTTKTMTMAMMMMMMMMIQLRGCYKYVRLQSAFPPFAQNTLKVSSIF